MAAHAPPAASGTQRGGHSKRGRATVSSVIEFPPVGISGAMRLLNTKTGRFEEFVDLRHAPPYAILSHTWDKGGEQSYEDVVKIQEQFGLAAHQSSDSVPPRAQTTLPTMNDAFGGSASSGISITTEDHQDTIRSSWLRRIRAPISRRKDEGRSVSPDGGVPTPSYPIPSILGLSPAAKGSAVYPPRPRPRSIWDPDSELSEKVRKACEIARRDGYGYIWVDSSCINKTSSSELSEAINSMFNWYRGAQVCYAFLVDVPSDDDVKALDPHYSAADRARGFDPPKDSKFRKSRWFQRAWTLQELVAPRLVAFLSQDWETLGTKDSLADLIEEITHIDRAILTHKKALADESVAERMRWAASRQATRVEDEAYSLLGIFGITMPTLYGEGEYAFRRLQEEILRRIPDQSLFAWGDGCEPLPIGSSEIRVYVKESDQQSIFAPSPRTFSFHSGKIIPASRDMLQSLDLPVEEYTPTPYGIRTQRLLLPLYTFNPMLTITGELGGVETWYLAILGYQLVDDQGLRQSRTGPLERRLLSRLCYITSSPQSTVEFLSIPYKSVSRYHPVFSIAQSVLNGTKSCAAHLQRRIVHLPHPKPPTPPQRTFKAADSNEYRAGLEISLSSWTQAALRPHGYTISDLHPTKNHPNPSSLTLFNASFNIHIQYRHMVIKFRDRIQVVIEARVWTLSSDSDEDAWSAMVQHTPPYTSATWVDETPRSMTLPQKRVCLLTPSEDEVMLQLGLSFTTPPQYNANIEIATDGEGATSGLSSRDKDLPGDPGMNAPHTDLKLTMKGSVRKALETRGYSVHFEHCPAAPHVDNAHSYALTMSNAVLGFTISIRYYHILRKCRRAFRQQELIVAARVVLESSPSVPNSNPSKMQHDGPYVVGWGDDYGMFSDLKLRWQWHQELKEICLATPNGRSVTLRLGLDLAWESEYYLVVDIGGDRDGDSRSGIGKGYGYSPHLLLNNNPRADRVSLTLPAHVKRALQTHGYDVHFKGPDKENSHPYHLTLSDANLTIDIEYSYDLCMDPKILRRWLLFRACVTTSPLTILRRWLLFRACVTTSPLRSTRSAAKGQSDCQSADWDAWRPDTRDEIDGGVLEPGGWYWDLPQKDVTLALPTGAELTLRLGFYLVWLCEYCLTVEVISPSSLPPTTSDEEPAPSSANTNRGSINEDAGDGAGMQQTAASEIDDLAVVAYFG